MMTFKDYMQAVKEDALEVMDEYRDYIDVWDDVYDALFIDDAVTGNGSGSYTFNAEQAKENARGLLFDDEFTAEAQGLGYGSEVFEQDPESLDVIARCLALGCVSAELEKHWNLLAL